MDALFTIIPIIIGAGFVYIIYTWIRDWRYNNSQPRVAAPATIVTKRQHHSTTTSSRSNHGHHHHGHDHHHHHHHGSVFNSSSTTTRTSYYVTFEFTTGDRLELEVDDDEYGLMIERDTGTLTFQGKRFISFVRS